MPQCPKQNGWTARPAREGREARTGVAHHIDLALEKTLDQYNIDKNSITLTGLSMGGYGTWSYGAEHTDIFAGLMPICGGGNVEDAEKLSKIPIWAFHGDADDVVPVERSRVMVEAVKQAGGNVKYTEYPGVDHGSWEPAYDDPESIAWLLKQRKN
jgi:predicted peptidase